mgnify:CR=1 FL=1
MGKGDLRPVGKWKFLILVILVLFLALGAPTICTAGDESVDVRPRIGLALGGGSALGFSHLGVLLWLEEHHIPVDYVSGTSMGGLIGGCYAMGMSPQEIVDLVTEINWATLFDPNIPYDSLSFRRKDDRRQYPVSAEVGLDLFGGGVKLPPGIFSYQVDLLLSRLTLPYSTVRRFEELPIPFSCIGADIDRAEAVVMEDGSLVEALRATMAIPGVFTPVLREGRLLVDGGLLNNVPADVVREQGLDQVIAVELTSATPQDRTGLGVLMRVINSVVTAGSRRTREWADVLISPAVEDLGLTDWGKVREFIDRGYQAAEEQRAKLEVLAVDDGTWAAYLAQREAKRRAIPVPDDIRLQGLDQVTESAVRIELETILNQPVDVMALEAKLLELLGTGLYESFRYECRQEEERTVLVVTAVPKTHGRAWLNFGLALDAELLNGQEASFAVKSRATFFDLLQPGAEGRLDLRVGTEPTVVGEWYLPLLNTSFFIAPVIFADQKNLSIYRDEARLSTYRMLQGGIGFDLGYNINRWGEVRCGYRVAEQKAALRVGSPNGLEGDGTVSRVQLNLEFDWLDHAFLPQTGGRFRLTNTWFFEAPGAEEPFGQSEGEYFFIIPLADRNSVFTRVASGVTWQGDAPLIQEFRLGGSFRLSAYQAGMWYGDNYILGSIGYLRRLTATSFYGQDLYLGLWWEEGGAFSRRPDRQTDSVISIGLLGFTLLGPVKCHLSLREDADPYLYLGVGHIF